MSRCFTCDCTPEERARRRNASHVGHRSNTPGGRDTALRGVLGEMALHAWTGSGRKPRCDQVNGDGGIDDWATFRCRDGALRELSIDVKASRDRKLLVEVGKVSAVLYILAMMRDGEMELVGWQHCTAVEAGPHEVHWGRMSHAITELEPMSKLEQRIIRG